MSTFNPMVSIVSSLDDGARTLEVRPIREVLEMIKNGSKDTAPVEKIRSAPDKQSRRAEKRKIKSFTASGVFPVGQSMEGKQPNPHSGLVQLDFDLDFNREQFATPELLSQAKTKLFQDEHIYSVFLSASALGLKAFARINPNDHERVFDALCKYIEERYGLIPDRSTRNANRLCFLSHDPDLMVKDDADEFRANPETDEAGELDSIVGSKEPIPGWEPEDAIEVLQYFSPDHYYDWLLVGMAIKHQFPDDRGLKIWDEWSQKTKSLNYSDKNLVDKWGRGIKANPKNGRPARTWRSVLFEAKQKGWNPAALSVRQFERMTHWLGEQARTTQELQTDSIARIADHSYITPKDREVLLDQIQARLKAREVRVMKSSLRRALQSKLAARRKTYPDPLPDWARGMIFLGGEFNRFIDASGKRHTPDSLDHMHGNQMPAWAELSPHEYLLNACNIPRAADLVYHPALKAQSIVTIPPPDPRAGLSAYNMYRATYPAALDYTHPENKRLIDRSEQLIRRHLEDMIREPEYQRILMDFMAYQVKNPGNKVRWAPFLQGTQGCGKGTIIAILAVALGSSNVRDVEGVSAIESNFNSFATGSQLVGLNEITNTGESHHRIYNKLKQLISESTVEVNEKFQPRVVVGNVTNYILTSNNRDALPFDEMGDRRYFVLMSSLQSREDIKAGNIESHCRELREFMEAHPGAVRTFFERWEISADFDPNGHAPRTPYLQIMAREAQTSLKREIREAIDSKDCLMVQPDLLTVAYLTALLPEIFQKTAPSKIGSVLRELGYESIDRVRVGKNGPRYSLWGVRNGPYFGDGGRDKAIKRLHEQIAQRKAEQNADI